MPGSGPKQSVPTLSLLSTTLDHGFENRVGGLQGFCSRSVFVHYMFNPVQSEQYSEIGDVWSCSLPFRNDTVCSLLGFDHTIPDGF